MTHGKQLSVVVSGMVCGVPRQGGATWAVLQYVSGLRRLGHDVMLIEQLSEEDTSAEVLAYFSDIVASFDLDARASLLSSRGAALAGVARASVERFASGADLVLNLSGTLTDQSLLDRVGMRVYVDLDPGFAQLWHETEGVDMGFDRHDRFVTVGLSIGNLRSDIPTDNRDWIPTCQPIDLQRWPVAVGRAKPVMTSVGHWRGYGSIRHQGVLYGQRAHSMRQLLPIAARSSIPIELALGIDPGERADISALRRHKWKLTDPTRVAGTPRDYASYVRSSWAELGVAKSGYVEARSGWFSDRSVCYLASGRPVIAQDTGFSDYLPTGAGLFAFQTTDQALTAIEEVRGDYRRHRVAAREIAEDLFDSRLVLSRLLELL